MAANLSILERAAGTSDEKPTVLEELEKSLHAAGQAVGLYHAETPEEKATLEKRFRADAISTGVGLGVGAIATPLAGGSFLGMMGAEALAGAAGGATHAAVEGDPILPDTIGGALLGAAFGALAGRVREGASLGEEAFGAAISTSQKIKTTVAREVEKLRKPTNTYSATVAGDPRTIKSLFSGVTGGVGEVRVRPSRGAAVALANEQLPTPTIRRAARRVASAEIANTGTELSAGLDHPAVPTHMWQAVTDEVMTKADELGATGVAKDLGWLANRIITPAGQALRKMGSAGTIMADLLDQSYNAAQLKTGDRVMALERVFKGMSKKQRIRIGDMLRGEDVPTTNEERFALGEVRSLLDGVAVDAHNAQLREFDPKSGAIKAFEYRKDYFPLVYKRETVLKYMQPGKEREDAIAWLLKHDQAINRAEAEKLLERFVHTPTEFRFGNLQMVRNFALPGFERDPLVALPKYLWRGQRRIEMANAFGAQDQVAEALWTKMGQEGFDAELAKEIYRAASDKAPRAASNLLRATRTFNILTLLWTAGIVQPAQLTNTAAWVGYKNMLRGLGVLFNKHGREWAEGTGAALSETIQAIVPESEGGWSTKWLDWIQLTKMDQANRLVSALAGRFHAQETALKYFGNQSGKHAKDLMRMGLNPEEVMAAGGKLTNEQLRLASLNVANSTQFRSAVQDLPIFKHTPLGEFMYLFKGFALQQLNFIGDLVQQAKPHSMGGAGDWAPLLRYLTGLGTLNYGVGEVVSYLKGHPHDESAWGYLNAIGSAGGLGIAYDALTAMESGPERIASLIGGPTAGQLYEFIGHDIRNLAFDQDPKPLLRDAIRHIPGIGRYLAPWLVPSE